MTENGRTTETLYLRVPPIVAQRAETDARRLGIPISEYVATLIQGRAPVGRPAADMQDVSLAGNRLVRAIGVLQTSQPDVQAAVALLREAQRFIFAELQKARPTYEGVIALRTDRMAGMEFESEALETEP